MTEQPLRPIVLARLDQERPALVLTRTRLHGERRWLTVAPITSTVRGLSSEVRVGSADGPRHEWVAVVDDADTIRFDQVVRIIGHLLLGQEEDPARAVEFAFDLTPPESL